jgi:acetamidase/formamidase
LPIYAPGALFSVDDAGAAHGQGEVDLSAMKGRKFQSIAVNTGRS